MNYVDRYFRLVRRIIKEGHNFELTPRKITILSPSIASFLVNMPHHGGVILTFTENSTVTVKVVFTI